MQETVKTRHSVSYHLKDLLKRDVGTVQEIANWLEQHAVKPRDVARRTVSKRMLARLIAAKQLLKAASGDVPAGQLVLDRTEGKVADRLQVETRQVHLHFNVNPPSTSLPHDSRMTESLQDGDNRLLTESALDSGSSVAGQVVERCLISGPDRGGAGEGFQEKPRQMEQVPRGSTNTSNGG